MIFWKNPAWWNQASTLSKDDPNSQWLMKNQGVMGAYHPKWVEFNERNNL